MDYVYKEHFKIKPSKPRKLSHIELWKKLDRNSSFYNNTEETVRRFFSEVPDVKRDVIINEILDVIYEKLRRA